MAPVRCVFFWWVFLSWATKARSDTLVNVTIPLGQITGTEENHVLPDGSLYVLRIFRGIPYASAPVGLLRFDKPRPVKPFPRPLEARWFGPACPQRQAVGNMSEDCLFLNIFAPKPTSPNPPSFPVIVWIHGGAFVSGEGKQLPAETLASYGNIIVVTMNFRIGALGFLSTGDSEASGNWGLWDQRLAVQWVKDHIVHFGGDPGKITLAGTTSGAFCVVHHALYPPNEGLFQRIIVESGSATSTLAYHTSGRKYAEALAEDLGCSLPDSDPNPSETIIACLREKDPESIASANIRPNFPFALTWTPVEDGEFIAEDPSTVLSWPPSVLVPSSLASVSALTGTTSSDGSVMFNVWVSAIASSMNETVSSGVSSGFLEKLVEVFVNSSLRSQGVTKEEVWVVSQAVVHEYRNWEVAASEAPSRGRELVSLFTDQGFFIPNVVFTRNHALSRSRGDNSSSTFMYQFHQRSPLPDPFPWMSGSLHKDQDLYVFGLPPDLLSGIVLDLATAEGASEWNFSQRVMTYWSNFVKSGNPNAPDPVPVEWPPFTLDNEDYLLLQAEKINARRHCRPGKTSFWLNFVPKVLHFAEEQRDKCAEICRSPSSRCQSVLLVPSVDNYRVTLIAVLTVLLCRSGPWWVV